MAVLNKNKRLIALLSLLVLVVGASAFFPFEKEKKGYAEGVILGSLDISSFGNEDAQSKEDIEKKPYILMEFFTRECPNCKKIIPELNALNRSDKVSVVGYVNDNSKKVRVYAKEYGVEYTLSRASREYTKVFNPVVVPMSFLVDTKTLKVKKSFIGRFSADQVLKYTN
jgi:thiol-disulfide isomerase/thioredoxin